MHVFECAAWYREVRCRVSNLTLGDASFYAGFSLHHEIDLAGRRGLVFATNQIVEAGDAEHFV